MQWEVQKPNGDWSNLFCSSDTLTERQRQYIKRRLAEEVPIDLRPLDPEGHFRIAGEEREPKQMYWIKAKGYIGE